MQGNVFLRLFLPCFESGRFNAVSRLPTLVGPAGEEAWDGLLTGDLSFVTEIVSLLRWRFVVTSQDFVSLFQDLIQL